MRRATRVVRPVLYQSRCSSFNSTSGSFRFYPSAPTTSSAQGGPTQADRTENIPKSGSTTDFTSSSQVNSQHSHVTGGTGNKQSIIGGGSAGSPAGGQGSHSVNMDKATKDSSSTASSSGVSSSSSGQARGNPEEYGTGQSATKSSNNSGSSASATAASSSSKKHNDPSGVYDKIEEKTSRK
eukprot:TRINITY_DN74_c4_g1_i2.p1 TRINITY_DN74_c4_g1~~TRINITY_DN74_c4_g1_i2.p1  ORF type:complete len:190 (+),score=51.65 TRINITY_DN74_c4_g1_i2:27-572(+)